jgi:2-(3-amino-3-carboxypropyl)histidine synthase
VHYGHSCLIPVDQTVGIKVLYVFVDIKIDSLHFVETVTLNFPNARLSKIALGQHNSVCCNLARRGQGVEAPGYEVVVPQSKPLSPGDILGCTAPRMPADHIIIYLGDGRFHLEAAMIANPLLQAYKYDPYEKKITQEFYGHREMRANRKKAIDQCRPARKFGLILGTLGHQGSNKVMEHLEKRIKYHKSDAATILLSEIFPSKLELFSDVDAFVQIACPRLSIDWSTAFCKPLLTPYELSVALGDAPWKLDSNVGSERLLSHGLLCHKELGRLDTEPQT